MSYTAYAIILGNLLEKDEFAAFLRQCGTKARPASSLRTLEVAVEQEEACTQRTVVEGEDPVEEDPEAALTPRWNSRAAHHR